MSNTSPLLLTITFEAFLSLPPVSNCGKLVGFGKSKLEDRADFSLIGTSKFSKCPGWLIRKIFCSGRRATVILPPGACNCPLLIAILPKRIKFFPGSTAKIPLLTIVPDPVNGKEKTFGVPIKEE